MESVTYDVGQVCGKGEMFTKLRARSMKGGYAIDKTVQLTSSRSLSKPFIGWEDMRWKSSLSSLVKVRDSLEVRVDMA